MSVSEELIHLAQAGDRDAAEKLVTENAGLIWAVARRFLGRGVETDDLYQLGCMGFLKAVDGFDLSFGTQFSTYAVWLLDAAKTINACGSWSLFASAWDCWGFTNMLIFLSPASTPPRGCRCHF